jgi:superfamily II DNA or RNA helicase
VSTQVVGGASSAECFLDAGRLTAGGPRAFARAVERLLWHLGFEDVRNIDGPGDAGGDLLAARGGSRWVFQCKWKRGGTVAETAIREVDSAKAFYGTDRAVVVTNRSFGRKALGHRQRLLGVGVRVDLWTGDTLAKFAAEIMPRFVPARYELRPYQRDAVAAARRGLAADRRALAVMATGLGKTVVAGEVIAEWLSAEPAGEVLVVAHAKELVRQLETALWRHVPKDVPTQVLTGDSARPQSLRGVTCATVQSALAAVEAGWRPGFVLVDEAHHSGETGVFQRLLDTLAETPTLAMTATPWRGDGFDIAERFGPPVFRMGIAEGMAAGFLAEVDYRLFVDELDWDAVAEASAQGLSVRELNRRLFIPRRDEAIADALREAWDTTPEPRAIVFCRTINHAEEFAGLLRSRGWARAACVSTRQTRRERDVLMSEFRDGRIPIVTAIDVFNEGVDVPDVNILCFMRVTHSRRIFVQQLGRGLRLRPGKTKVEVLDFVSDVRRVAATLDLQRALQQLDRDLIEHVDVAPQMVRFSEPSIGTFLDEWIRDAAELEDAGEEVRLQFPEVPYS